MKTGTSAPRPAPRARAPGHGTLCNGSNNPTAHFENELTIEHELIVRGGFAGKHLNDNMALTAQRLDRIAQSRVMPGR